MSRLPLTAALVTLLLFGGATIFSTLAGTPAFNDSLQEENVLGLNRLGSAHTRYDRAEYLRLVGMTFLRAQLLPPGIPLIDGESGPVTPDVALARATRATDLLSRSISNAPADAETWRQLAWGLAMAGKAEAARVALGKSWTLAPYSRQIAARRLSLVGVLFAESDSDRPSVTARSPTLEEEAGIARDLETLRKLSPHEYHVHARRLPREFQ